MKTVKIKKLRDNAIMPAYATDGSAAFDLYSAVDCDEINHAKTISTGLAFEIPNGYCMKIYSRSGHGFKQGVRLANCVGIIDSDYRGELLVKLTGDHYHLGGGGRVESCLEIKAGDRIAQGIIVPVEQVQFEWSNELSSTERGAGGFGSTGV
jgi:dUTP pyrophosphatase